MSNSGESSAQPTHTPPADSALPFHLRGNYAPVLTEQTAFHLPVSGVVPRALSGLYVRNGPNPKTGQSPHWFFGDGMLHGVALRDGQAAWYRNRWVRTRAFLEDVPNTDQQGNRDLTVGVANTHVIAHAGRILALVETAFPMEMTRDLETRGCFDFGGKLTTGMTAHPKVCPRTGELHFFYYSYMPPFLVYHRADASGRLVQSEPIDVPGPTMMHDFAITDRHVVFMDLPIVFDLELAMANTMPYRWSDEYGARLGVMPRGGANQDVRWFEIAPCYVFHPLNAYEDAQGAVVVDVSATRSCGGPAQRRPSRRRNGRRAAGRFRSFTAGESTSPADGSANSLSTIEAWSSPAATSVESAWPIATAMRSIRTKEQIRAKARR